MGDIVFIRDLNSIRGDWQIGQIDKVYRGNDNIIREVDIRSKIPSNKKCSFMKRAIQGIVTLLPVEENIDG